MYCKQQIQTANTSTNNLPTNLQTFSVTTYKTNVQIHKRKTACTNPPTNYPEALQQQQQQNGRDEEIRSNITFFVP